MTKVLKLKFTDELAKSRVIKISNPVEGLKADVIKASMQAIIDSNAFVNVKTGYKLYTAIDSASYYETNETQLLEDAE